MKPRQKRIAIIVGGLASLGLATYFVLKALDSNIALFYTPTQVRIGLSVSVVWSRLVRCSATT